jgi:hypothetical protein
MNKSIIKIALVVLTVVLSFLVPTPVHAKEASVKRSIIDIVISPLKCKLFHCDDGGAPGVPEIE